MKRLDNELLIGKQSAVAEARALFGMMQRGSVTIEELRELIAVPERMEKWLRAWAEESPEDAHWMEAAIKFRAAVAREFERLVAEGVPVADLPEVEEAESGAGEQVLAAAPA